MSMGLIYYDISALWAYISMRMGLIFSDISASWAYISMPMGLISSNVALLMKKTILDHVRLAKGLITTPLWTDVRMQLGHFPMTNSLKESATG